MFEPSTQQDAAPKPLEYARATKPARVEEAVKVPPAFTWLLIVSLVLLAGTVLVTGWIGPNPGRLVIEILGWLDLVAIAVMNILAMWSCWLILTDKRFLQSTIMIAGLVVAGTIAICGDLFIVMAM